MKAKASRNSHKRPTPGIVPTSGSHFISAASNCKGQTKKSLLGCVLLSRRLRPPQEAVNTPDAKRLWLKPYAAFFNAEKFIPTHARRELQPLNLQIHTCTTRTSTTQSSNPHLHDANFNRLTFKSTLARRELQPLDACWHVMVFPQKSIRRCQN